MSIAARSASRRWQLGCTVLAGVGAIAGGVALAGAAPGWLAASAGTKHLVALAMALFAAAVLSSIVGFAFSAIAGAMIFHLVPNGVEAVQMMMIASIGIQAYTVAAMYRSIEWRRCLGPIAGGVLTLPLGVMLLFALPPRLYLVSIGAVLIAYGAYMQCARPKTRSAAGKRSLGAVAVGAAGGITGPLAAFPAACLVIWCGRQGWDKTTQRAIYQPYILVMQLLALGLLCAQRPGAIEPLGIACVIPGVAGAIIGVRLFKSLSDDGFKRLVNVALIGSGIALLLR